MSEVYREYRDSGTDWLGMVPAHWSVSAMKHVADFVNGAAFKPEDWSDEGTPIIRIENLNGGTDFNCYGGEVDRRYIVQTGDILFGWSGNRGTSFGPFIWTRPGRHFLNQHIFNVRGFTCDPAWFYWCLKAVTQHVEEQAHGIIGMVHITKGDLGAVRIPLPPSIEQLAIAAFLDRETSKIDALVEEQRRLIELLKERRQAVISHGVTKGLDPNAKLKPSGVEWLGEVPEHWEVVPCGYRYEVQLGRMLNEERSQGDDLRPYLRVVDVQWGRINVDELPLMDFPPDARQRYRLQPGDLLVNEGGSYVGRSAIWRGELEECYYQKALHRLRPRDVQSDATDFLLWVMEMATKIGAFIAGGNQTTIDHLTAQQLRSQRFPFPPHAEQEQIARFLAGATEQLDRLEREAAAAIALLTERRSALISAAVTGKLDVRPQAAGSRPVFDSARLRTMVAAEIIDQLAEKKVFGRVKLQKLLYLAEVDAGIVELQGSYLREAAGPLDRDLITYVEAELQQAGHVAVDQPNGPGSPVTYRLGSSKRVYRNELAAALGDRSRALARLITTLGDLDTRAVEAITTLYAVWNDALIEKHAPTDPEIVAGVLEDWHPEKAEKFKSEELLTWLGWMRRQELLPRGTGPRTVTGRLFA